MPAPETALQADRASADFLGLIPRDYARDHGILSQGLGADGDEILAIVCGIDPYVVHNVGVRLGRSVSTRPVEAEILHRVIDQAYEQGQAREPQPAVTTDHTADGDDSTADLERLLAAADRDLLATDGKAPMIRIVDRLLFHAVQLGASDLHVHPLADAVKIRHRIDGVLDEGREVPLKILRPLVNRIKVMAGMDVAERLIPQDGRCSVTIGQRSIDLRVSSLPTTYGERVVVRLLDADKQLCRYEALGMPADIGRRFLDRARKSNGIILVTGPTGSGKTTTLYATLLELNSTERNLMTVEDPIEYDLEALGLPISQTQVNEKKGVSFANGLRHILRQDPDVILVGEIRDAETARMAIQSSLTGHLVFSTLHTNDAVSAVTRLIDLGVEPYLVSASLAAVLAQRLVRLVCTTCRGTDPDCPLCHGTGYHGRTGVFELLEVDGPIKQAIGAGATLEELRGKAREAGMRSLLDEGRRLIEQDLTTTVEVERAIHG